MRQRILLAKQALEKERAKRTERERVVATTRPAVEYTFGVEESF